jgi:hypothetical protein
VARRHVLRRDPLDERAQRLVLLLERGELGVAELRQHAIAHLGRRCLQLLQRGGHRDGQDEQKG